MHLDLKDGKLQIEQVVAYHIDHRLGPAHKVRTLMLSVYVRMWRSRTEKVYTRQTGARMHVPRSTPEAEQRALLDALTYKVALSYNRDYCLLAEPNLKKPSKE